VITDRHQPEHSSEWVKRAGSKVERGCEGPVLAVSVHASFMF